MIIIKTHAFFPHWLISALTLTMEVVAAPSWVWRGFLWRDQFPPINKQQNSRMSADMMEVVAAPSGTIGSSSCGMSYSDLSIGLDVQITSRTWPGINKPGGHATITAIQPCHTRVDVKYVLGGREKNVELIYVRPYVELDRRGRERRRDVKMNVDTLGGTQTKTKKRGSSNSNNDDEEDKAAPSTKKGRRTALSFIDGNGGKQQQGGTTIATTSVAAVAGADGNTTASTTTKVDNDSWTLIKVSVVIRSVCTNFSLTIAMYIYIIIISLFAFSPSFIYP
jgi:hypothetical protein